MATQFYVNHLVVTKQKPIVDLQKIKKRELEHTNTEHHYFTKECVKNTNKKKKELKNSQKTIKTCH